MDTRDGRIVDIEEIRKLEINEQKFFKEMKLKPTKKQLARNPARVGRNEPCPCGSGEKFKKCCFGAVNNGNE